MLTINEIRIENRRFDPEATQAIVTDSRRPRFSFSVTGGRRGASLRSASVEVNGWKGEVRDQLFTPYDGPELEPLHGYGVTITATDDAGETAQAEAFFRTGKLGGRWRGKWISDGDYHFESPASPTPMLFSRRFALKKSARRITVMATAMGIFDLMLDGKRISDEYFSPGFTSYPAQLQYVSYTLENVKAGQHEFSAVVAGGWAVGRSTHINDTNKSVSKLSAERQALLAELHIEYTDGKRGIIGTDERFRVTEDSAWRFAEFYDGEVYDAGRSPDGMIWKQARLEKLKIRPRILARYGEPVRAHEVLEPVAWQKTPSGELICDFGQNIAGVIEMKLRGKAGQKITIRHAEALEKGELYTQNLRSAKQRVTYLCRDGEQRYSPRLTYMGFRYVGITGISQSDLELRAVAVYSDVQRIGDFRCSNEDLNRLQSNLAWSGKDNFVDIPTDCPQRDERQGWTGDIALFASTACFNFDMDRFLDKWLLDLKSEQGPTGGIPMVIPQRKGVTTCITTSCWGDSCVLVPYAVYLSRGDKELLERQYSSMKRFVADVKRWAALSAPMYGTPYIFKLPFQFGDWCAPYGTPPDWFARGPWVGTAYFANTCSLMGKIAAVLGKEQESRNYYRLAERVKAAFCNVFTDGNGRLKEEFQTGYVLALHFGLVEGDARKRMAGHLWRLIEKDGCHLSTGFPATPYILFALADNGYEKEAYQLLLQESDPSWLYQVRHGGTTLWEQWGAVQEDGSIKEASLNHYAYGAVGDFFYRRICGLEALEAGYRRFRVKPVPGGELTWAECEHCSPFGMIRVRWDRTDDKFVLKVTVPVGAACEIGMPCGRTYSIGSGSYEFEQAI